MRALKTGCFCLMLALPTPGHAGDGEPAGSGDYSDLWTGWARVNQESMQHETEAMRRVRQDVASAYATDAERLRALQRQGRALGERVGEIVRLGDCEEGERVARAAGDFALVEAVRGHCRAVAAAEAPAR